MNAILLLARRRHLTPSEYYLLSMYSYGTNNERYIIQLVIISVLSFYIEKLYETGWVTHTGGFRLFLRFNSISEEVLSHLHLLH